MSGLEELSELAVRAATAAGDELLRRYGRVTGVGTKSSATDPVSDADRAAERVLVDTIAGVRPADGFVGEEGSTRAGGSGLDWVVDPLDGTVNYLYGLPVWCVSVACEDAHGGLVGVVHDPLRAETFTAARGGGAWLRTAGPGHGTGGPLRVNDPVALDRALVGTGFGYDPDERRGQAATVAELLPRVRDVRRGGSAALDLCWVAAGRLDGYYEDLRSRWDWAAGALIAAEAGAVVTVTERADGRGCVVVAGPALHGPLRARTAGNG